jgi:dipeptidyl aminopeptidase/acylaminoacyl peptidase
MRSALFAILSAALAVPVSAEPPPLIPRDILFGNPERANPQLSPDGKYLAYLRPDDKNVLQVWVRTLGQDDDRAVTADPKRGIRQYYWAYDGQHLLYLQDTGGDENFHLYATNLETQQTRDLTPFPGVRVAGVELDEKFPDQAVIFLNQRDRTAFDAHRLTLATGEVKPDTQNPGNFVGWATDAALQVRSALTMNPDGGQDLMVRDEPGAPWRKIRSWTHEEQGSPGTWAKDGRSLYLAHNGGVNTVRFVRLNVSSGQEEVLAEDPEYDVSGVMFHPRERTPQAVSFTRARTEWTVLDPAVQQDFAILAKAHRGDFAVVSRTQDDRRWLAAYTVDDGPTAYYLYDRDAKKPTLLFTNNSRLEKLPLARTEPIEFAAQDGLTIRGYLTRPVGAEEQKVPMVLLVHGGPWARDTWGYSPIVQWLANRGYAVLQVNFRGSTGYGKAFLNAGNREWAGKMHQDLLDGVDYVVAKGGIDKDRVAIMGGSYGGYATLVGLTFTPDRFACGVDIVGPSNIVTLLKSVPPYWAPMKAIFTKRVGDLEADREFLESRSPLFKVNEITKPLLIGQGANDPRVKQAESDQIVEAMRRNNKEVQYVVYPDEGHGFARPENRLHFFAVAEEFLAKHLGGRAEPIGEIPGHTGQMK